MQKKVFYNQDQTFRWIDIVGPSAEDLQTLAQEFGLHKTLVEDSLEPYHLPKYERVDEKRFIILRVMDETATEDESTILELTRKVAIFAGPGFLLTIHRRAIPYLDLLKEKWEARLLTYVGDPKNHLLLDILSEGFQTFDQELSNNSEKLEDLEVAVFNLKPKKYNFRSLYLLKRRSSVSRRILRLSSEVVSRFAIDMESNSQLFVRDLKEDLENSLNYADDLIEGLNQLLTTHHSLESEKANEVMRVLAIFSAFFFPVTLIAGIYGMNFKVMPELNWEWGYLFALSLMGLTSLFIFIWFKRKKWL